MNDKPVAGARPAARFRDLKATTSLGTAALGTAAAALMLMGGLPAAEAQDAQEAQAQMAPGAGSFPNSFLIPGTNTSIRVGGYAKLDFATSSPFQSQQFGANWAAIPIRGPLSAGGPGFGVPGHPSVNSGYYAYNRKFGTELTATESHFNVETRTPTSYGEFKTLFEGDMEGTSGLSPYSGNQNFIYVNSNSFAFRFRQAYGTLGPFLAGQTFSNFLDLGSEPETLDFTGPAGLSGVLRQSQVRYTYAAGGGWTFATALENPEIDYAGLGSSNPTGLSQLPAGSGNYSISHVPDLTEQVRLDGAWGHISLHGLLRDIMIDNGGATPSRQALGYAGGVSGQYNTRLGAGGKDSLQWDFEVGRGLGRYILNLNPPDAAYNSLTGQFTLLTDWSADVAYQHWWTTTIRSTAAWGWVHIQNAPGAFTSAGFANDAANWNADNKLYTTVHANLIWSPIPQIDLGGEFMYGYRQVWGGADGSIYKLQFSAKYRF